LIVTADQTGARFVANIKITQRNVWFFLTNKKYGLIYVSI
jgi:hypothetical protein